VGRNGRQGREGKWGGGGSVRDWCRGWEGGQCGGALGWWEVEGGEKGYLEDDGKVWVAGILGRGGIKELGILGRVEESSGSKEKGPGGTGVEIERGGVSGTG